MPIQWSNVITKVVTTVIVSQHTIEVVGFRVGIRAN